MNRWKNVASCLGLVVLVCAVLLAGDSPQVESAQFKASDLETITGNGAIQLLGFSWKGEARRFDAGLGVADLVTRGPEDRSFSILGKGGASACEALTKKTSEGNSLPKVRLTFRSAEGSATTFRLGGVTTQQVDCAAKPWAASLVAEKVSKAAAGGTERKKIKKQGEATRLERVGSRG